jgi:hypothetical protein
VPHILERAPTGRAKCRACGAPIAAGDWRLGERLPNPYTEDEGAEMTHWFHLTCAAFKRPEPFVAALESADPPPAIDGRETLEHEARLGLTHRRLPRVDAASRAPSSRAACRACKAKIEKGTWRIGLVWYEDGRFMPAGYIHVSCVPAYLETTDIMTRLRYGSKDLTPEDVAELDVVLRQSGGA